MRRRVAASITASALFLTPLAAFATTDGPNYPAVGSNNSDSGITAWSNPGNISANDASYASFSSGANSQYLRARDYGFAIPTDATIKGIQVTVGRRATQTGGNGTRDPELSLYRGGTGISGRGQADPLTD